MIPSRTRKDADNSVKQTTTLSGDILPKRHQGRFCKVARCLNGRREHQRNDPEWWPTGPTGIGAGRHQIGKSWW